METTTATKTELILNEDNYCYKFHTHIRQFTPGVYTSKVWNQCVHKVMWSMDPEGKPTDIKVGDYHEEIKEPTHGQLEHAKVLIHNSLIQFEVIDDAGNQTGKNFWGEDSHSTYYIIKEGIDYPLSTLMRLNFNNH